MKLTLILNQKGGVGKTTLAMTLATGFKRHGHKTLLVNTAHQSGLDDWVSIIRDKNPDIELPVCIKLDKRSAIHDITQLGQDFDHVVVDTQGTFGDSGWNIIEPILHQADLAIIPITPSALDVLDSMEIVKIIKKLNAGDGKPRLRYFMGMRIESSTISNEIANEIKNIDVKILNAYTTFRMDFRRMVDSGKTIFETSLAKQGNTITQEILELYGESEDGIYSVQVG